MERDEKPRGQRFTRAVFLDYPLALAPAMSDQNAAAYLKRRPAQGYSHSRKVVSRIDLRAMPSVASIP